MRMTRWLWVAAAVAAGAGASEVTVRNDSVDNDTSGVIVTGFAPGEAAASWLTSPCDGSVVAAQVFWRSQDGTSAQVIGDSIDLYRAGAFPEPAALTASIGGPVLTDGVINEYRYLDENNTVPLAVPVSQAETFVLSFTFAEAPPAPDGPSVVRDTNGITPSHNALYGDVGAGLAWYDAAALGVTGDWVLRAVVDCQAGSTNADVSVSMSADAAGYSPGMALTYTITVTNAGPANAAGVTVVDAFPSAYLNPAWTCASSGGATCAAGGSGTIAQSTTLPPGSVVVFTVTGTVAADTSGTLTNVANAVVAPPASDPDATNNMATLDLPATTTDAIFADGFEAPGQSLMRSESFRGGRRADERPR